MQTDSLQQAADFVSEGRDGPWDAGSIPTHDPQAALRFCQSLAQFLNEWDTLPGGWTAGSPANALDLAVPPLAQPELSVVLPVYEERENLPLLYDRLTGILRDTELEYELIFVDDGSHDLSGELVEGLSEHDPRITLVQLARNFGHQVAISAGLEFARGQAVIVMDADLQDPPEMLPQLIARWREGYEVVYAVRASRKEGLLKRVAYKIFYRLLQRVASVEIPLDAGDFCIMDRRVVDLLVQMPERNRFLRGIRSWVGFKQIGLPYERQARNAGAPKYNLTRLVFLALDGLFSFSYMPLRVISVLGFVISFISICLAVFYAVKRAFFGLNPPGFATLVVAIFFFAGIQLTTIGLIGEYVGRVFEEVKGRPLYVLRRVIRGQGVQNGEFRSRSF